MIKKINLRLVNLICNLTGDNSRDKLVSFGTEAGLFQEMGISTVVCGPGSIEQAHKIDEYVISRTTKRMFKVIRFKLMIILPKTNHSNHLQL